jgi:thiazole synthase
MGTDDPFVVAGKRWGSRLIVGTGKYKDLDETRRAVAASGAEIVTVALRRLEQTGPSRPPEGGANKAGVSRQGFDLLDALRGFVVLPNTAGCYTVEEAVRTARLGRELCQSDLVKLEVIGDKRTLFPDAEATLLATRVLVKEGFTVLPYTNDDPVMAKKLEDAGASAVMPLAAPIGSGLGIRNPYNLRIILETVKVPIIVDAGVGTASDAAMAMELGLDAVLMNTGIAGAKEPVLMAEAMKLAVDAGRKAFLAGRIAKKLHAAASSPEHGLIE